MASSGATISGTPDVNTVRAAAAFDLMFHSGSRRRAGLRRRGRTAPPISAMALDLASAMPGSTIVSSAATFVSSPTAMIVSVAGPRFDLLPHEGDAALRVQRRRREAGGPLRLLHVLRRGRRSRRTRARAPQRPPSIASSFAASRARATASPDTVVTPSSSSSGLRRISASA